MAYENLGESLLDYLPCRYGKSKLLFRGPRRKLKGDYIAFIGGTKTYGKFIEDPFCELVEQDLELPCVNLGCVNAGVDVFGTDDSLLDICSGATATVVQLLGAQNMSNRFYTVHPRRNDRFVRATPTLEAIYPEVDFTEFNFTRHLLTSLRKRSPERFEPIRRELKSTWVARMKRLLDRIDGKTLLLWLSDHYPEDADETGRGLGDAPLFVDRAMIDAVRSNSDDYIEVALDPCLMSDDTHGMVFSPMEKPAAREMMGQRAHQHVALNLAPVLVDLIEKRARETRAL